MNNEQLSKQQLLKELKGLQAKLVTFEQEKQDLEISLKTIIEHADLVQSELLLEVQNLRGTLKTFEQEKFDLEISLETIIDHADIIENELLDTQSYLEREVARRTKELKRSNGLLTKEIIERQKIQYAQENNLRFLGALLNSIPNPIFYKNKQGVYLGCNHAFETALGIKEADLKGKTVYDLYSHATAMHFSQLDQAILNNGGHQTFETTVPFADGTQRCVIINKTTFTDIQGHISGLVGILLDITERKKAETELRLAASVFEASNEGILITDEHGHIISVNKAYERLTGYSAEESIGKTPAMLKSGQHSPLFYQNMWESLLTVGHWSGEVWNRRHNGEVFPEWLSISAVRDIEGQVIHYVALFTDITDKKLSEKQIYHLTHYDALTDLPNRVLFQERLEQALRRANRQSYWVALILIDLDHFKAINDTFGHHLGDDLLKEVAKRLTQSVQGEQDAIARLGGDEFIVLLDDLPANTSTLQTVSLLTENILQQLQHVAVIHQKDIFTSASIGIAVYPQDGSNAAELLKNADTAVYDAKAHGRNTYHYFTSAMNVAVNKRLHLQNHLRRAVEREEFFLHYQPQVDTITRKIIGVEALLRWKHPELGFISPADFIPLAEDSGLINVIGEWVLHTACQQNKAWQQAGLPPIRMAVNLSVRQFYDDNLLTSVKTVLNKTQLDPMWLELEITENIAMSYADRTLNTLKALKELGLQLAIDDFGTGYSSLTYLKQFPIDVLKIDSSFTMDISTKSGAAIVSAIINMAHSLNLNVVAEGVEDNQQLSFLQNHVCDCMQGFFFYRPESAKKIEQLLQQQAS